VPSFDLRRRFATSRTRGGNSVPFHCDDDVPAPPAAAAAAAAAGVHVSRLAG